MGAEHERAKAPSRRKQQEVGAMNHRTQAQWSVTGVVEAPPDQAWQALLDTLPMISPQTRRELARDASPDFVKMLVENPGGGHSQLEVNKRQHRVAIQGEWWYRGVYSLTPHPQGCLLVYQVYNVAPGMSWWLARVVQGPQHARKMKAELQALLRAISDALGHSAATRRARPRD
jgi:hypothetical protein